MKARIINLSSMHTLNMNRSIDEFARLHFEHAPYFCRPSMTYSRLWVRFILFTHQNLINEYKLGRIGTDRFVEEALKLFDFLEKDDTSRKAIITAWNAMVYFENGDIKKFENLIQDKDYVHYFISNTNPLHLEKILSAVFPNIKIDYSSKDQPFVPLKDNLYICPSFHVSTFKVDNDNENYASPGTPELLAMVVNELIQKHNCNKSEIEVVSQYGKDLISAQALGVTTHEAQHFFKTGVGTHFKRD